MFYHYVKYTYLTFVISLEFKHQQTLCIVILHFNFHLLIYFILTCIDILLPNKELLTYISGLFYIFSPLGILLVHEKKQNRLIFFQHFNFNRNIYMKIDNEEQIKWLTRNKLIANIASRTCLLEDFPLCGLNNNLNYSMAGLCLLNPDSIPTIMTQEN